MGRGMAAPLLDQQGSDGTVDGSHRSQYLARVGARRRLVAASADDSSDDGGGSEDGSGGGDKAGDPGLLEEICHATFEAATSGAPATDGELDVSERALVGCLEDMDTCQQAPQQVSRLLRALPGWEPLKSPRPRCTTADLRAGARCSAAAASAALTTGTGDGGAVDRSSEQATQPTNQGGGGGVAAASSLSSGAKLLGATVRAFRPLTQRFTTCAVVGGARALLSAAPGNGAAIDRHNAVFRIGLGAPGREGKIAGTRTTLRLVTGEDLRRLAANEGAPDDVTGQSLVFWEPSVLRASKDGRSPLMAVREGLSLASFHFLSDDMVKWALSIYFGVMSDTHRLRLGMRPSGTGTRGQQGQRGQSPQWQDTCPRALVPEVLATLLAMRMCDRVNLFGVAYQPSQLAPLPPAATAQPGLPTTYWHKAATSLSPPSSSSPSLSSTSTAAPYFFDGAFLQQLHLARRVTICTAET
eukprot:jgi/Mesvir1/1047/Mv17570-RA.1